MKIFLSTLSAILVAAIIIWFVVSAHNARVAVASAIQRDELRKITLQRELQHANAEWKEQMRRDPQFDPKAEKMRSRLREIKEASENGKPIPPNPWQSSGQQKQTANETERPQPNQNPPPQYVTVKRDIEVSHGTTKIVIPTGTKLLVVSRASGIVGVLFGNESVIIPESATTEFK